MVSLCDSVVFLSWNKLVIPYVIIDHYTVVYSHDQQDREMNAVFPHSATSGIISDLSSTVVYRFQVFATITVDGRTVDGERSTVVHFGINSKQQTIIQQGLWMIKAAEDFIYFSVGTLSTKSSSNAVTPIVVGVVIAIIGAVIGVIGGTFGVFTAYMKRHALTKQVEYL